ncbi:hypothetical protein [Streptomyces sp. NPDC054784]
MAADDARDAERGHPEGASLAPVPLSGRGPLRLWRRRDDAAAVEDTDGDERREGERRGRVRAFLGVVADRVVDTAPRIPVRELETLRRQFPGLGPEEIADRLVSTATKGSATVGAGVGAAAMMPVPPAMPAELAAELVGVATVELKLIAELHEVYGCRAPGSVSERSAAYLASWTTQRGINLTKPTTLNAALGGQLKRRLRQEIMKRSVRNLPNLAPFMVGAAVGAVMNSHDTARLARSIRADLRRTQIPWDALPPAPGAVPGLGSGTEGPGPSGDGRTLPPGRSS